MSDHVSVKVTLIEHHLLQIPKSAETIESVKNEIKKSFPLLNQPNVAIKIYWKDSDGDRIQLTSTDDLKDAVRHVNGNKLQLEIQADVAPQSPAITHQPVLQHSHSVVGEASSYRSMNSQYYASTQTCRSSLAEFDVRGPPVEEKLYNSSSSSANLYESQDSEGNGIPESIARQTSSASDQQQSEQIDLPSDFQLIEGWPTPDSYALNMFKKMTKTLDGNFLTDKTYKTDVDRQCRVLCILNKESAGKPIYPSTYDMEITFLQQAKKVLKWDLQIHKDKTSAEILSILDEEKGRDFSTVHSLFVIIITRGDRNGIYGTTGELIEYWKVTTRFDQVPTLKGKPKIFIIDDCEIGSDIHDEVFGLTTGIQGSQITDNPTTYRKQYLRSYSGREVLADETDAQCFSNQPLDTYVCKASTMGRCDKVVKGSWVIGALLSVISKAGNKMTFQKMMEQVEMMLRTGAPTNKPEPVMVVKNCLTKDLYLLPPPC